MSRPAYECQEDTVHGVQNKDDVTTKTLTLTLKWCKIFRYLRSWTQSSLKDINTRQAQAWRACNKLTKIWKSNLPRPSKIKLFQATVESILLYGSETDCNNQSSKNVGWVLH